MNTPDLADADQVFGAEPTNFTSVAGEEGASYLSELARLEIESKSIVERRSTALTTSVDSPPVEMSSWAAGTISESDAARSRPIDLRIRKKGKPRDFGANQVELYSTGLDDPISDRWEEILEVGLSSEFEDGTEGPFDEKLDEFLSEETSKRILFGWASLQNRAHRFVFYRFLERLGYCSVIGTEQIPKGLLQSALNSSMPGVRAAAAHALGNLGDQNSIQMLDSRSFLERNPVVAEIIRRHVLDHATSSKNKE